MAWTLVLTVLLVALGATTSLRRSHVRTEAALDAMQRARIACETLTRELRLAGLGVDPDGDPGRPDEPIEGAWAGAIAMRADLDASDPSAAEDPESWIAGRFSTTRTGNDEIVAYALRKENGTGGSDVTFDADVASPETIVTPSGDRVAARDGLVESVKLTRVVAASTGEAGEGCVLYRAMVANSAVLWGTGNAITWQPLADGISTLSFTYFDESGAVLAPPGGAENGRSIRLRIARIEVRLVALERRPDPDWIDSSDASPATQHYRKAEVLCRVTLRNAGLAGRVDPEGEE